MEDQWRLRKAEEIQSLSDTKDSKNLFAALKEVYGPTVGTLVPVASADGSQIYTEKHEIMCRWVEHFRSVLNLHVALTLKEATIEEVEQRPICEAQAEAPQMEELEKAIKLQYIQQWQITWN